MKGKGRLRVQNRNVEEFDDSYLNKSHPKDFSYCERCHAIYHNKHWFFDENKLKEIEKSAQFSHTTCPACQKIKDHFPSGIVQLSGLFLRDHKEEIINLVMNEEERAKGINPLERIIEILPNREGIEVTTTHEKLAQRIGRRLEKSFSGKSNYQWMPEEKMARVSWCRD